MYNSVGSNSSSLAPWIFSGGAELSFPNCVLVKGCGQNVDHSEQAHRDSHQCKHKPSTGSINNVHTEQRDHPSERRQKCPDQLHHGGSRPLRRFPLQGFQFQKSEETCHHNYQTHDKKRLAEGAGEICDPHTGHGQTDQKRCETPSLSCTCCHENSFPAP